MYLRILTNIMFSAKSPSASMCCQKFPLRNRKIKLLTLLGSPVEEAWSDRVGVLTYKNYRLDINVDIGCLRAHGCGCFRAPTGLNDRFGAKDSMRGLAMPICTYLSLFAPHFDKKLLVPHELRKMDGCCSMGRQLDGRESCSRGICVDSGSGRSNCPSWSAPITQSHGSWPMSR
jgi:hypothetical protein